MRHHPDRPSTSHSRQSRRRVHRAGRTCVVGVAGRAQRTRPVVGDGAEHPGASRGAGTRSPAAHVGGPHPDRLRVTGSTSICCSARTGAPGRRPTSRPGCAASGTVGDLLEHASQELSRASHQVGFAMAPTAPTARLRHIDFVILDGRRVLVVVVATGGHVIHKIIETRRALRCGRLDAGGQLRQRRIRRADAHEARAAIRRTAARRASCSTTRSCGARSTWPARALPRWRRKTCSTSRARRFSSTSSGRRSRGSAAHARARCGCSSA